MKQIFFLLVVCFLGSFLEINAQFSKYIIRFKDKKANPFTISEPSRFLSAKSLQRRTRQNISIDETDLPVTPAYIDSVRLAGDVTILNRSKWLNQVCIETKDADALVKINSFSFVLGSQPLMRPITNAVSVNKFNEEIDMATLLNTYQTTEDHFNYGSSQAQIDIHEGEFLHNKGFTGQGMLIAMMDAGFFNYKTITAFDSVRTNNQVAETYDFVKNETSVDEDSPHGMFCFSIIAANWPGRLVGSCPKATFYLYRTEDAASEFPIEEQNWVAAAERADSIGVDVFSTSLGYTTFNNPVFNYTYQQLDGNTTIIARASDLAAKKGIICVVAAGNEGNKNWHFISTPADADSALVVAAVNSSGAVADFSSYGPSADGQVKPTVASIGQGTAIANINNQPAFGNGTSLATPNLAGLITCLWQAFPEFTNMEIIEAVKQSSSIYTNPNDRIGYGIPNFRKAYEDLLEQRTVKNIDNIMGEEYLKMYPNPFKQTFTVLLKPQHSGKATFMLYDASGRLYQAKQVDIQSGRPQLIHFRDLGLLAPGVYSLKYNDGVSAKTLKILRQ